MRLHLALLCSLFACLLSGCSDDSPTQAVPAAGTVKVRILHHVDVEGLSFSDIRYTNAAGEQYSVVRLNYLISNIELVATNGGRFLAPGPFFVDAAADSTLQQVLSNVPSGEYEQISFTFGLDETVNKSAAFINEPWHPKMFWPDELGGGYHYMMLDGFVAVPNPGGEPTERNHNTHLGRTQNDPHYFKVTLEILNIRVDGNESLIDLAFDISQWYETPNVYMFPDPGFIMDRPDVQEILKANGASVFSASTGTVDPTKP